MQYEDEDNDKVILASDGDLVAAVEHAKSIDWKVTLKNTYIIHFVNQSCFGLGSRNMVAKVQNPNPYLDRFKESLWYFP